MPGKINVLLVDDDLDDHDFFIEAVENFPVLGCNVSSAYNGAEAMGLLNTPKPVRGSVARLPDFIVLDLNMPVLDGFAVMQQMQSQKSLKDIPVYILTTSTRPEHKTQCEEMGCAGYYSKPQNYKGLKYVIQDMFNNFANIDSE